MDYFILASMTRRENEVEFSFSNSSVIRKSISAPNGWNDLGKLEIDWMCFKRWKEACKDIYYSIYKDEWVSKFYKSEIKLFLLLGKVESIKEITRM